MGESENNCLCTSFQCGYGEYHWDHIHGHISTSHEIAVFAIFNRFANILGTSAWFCMINWKWKGIWGQILCAREISDTTYSMEHIFSYTSAIVGHVLAGLFSGGLGCWGRVPGKHLQWRIPTNPYNSKKFGNRKCHYPMEECFDSASGVHNLVGLRLLLFSFTLIFFGEEIV